MEIPPCYILVEIGCLECEYDSYLVGVFESKEDAQKLIPEKIGRNVDYCIFHWPSLERVYV